MSDTPHPGSTHSPISDSEAPQQGGGSSDAAGGMAAGSVEYQHSSFYKFVPMDETAALAQQLRDVHVQLGRSVGGNILLAPEGITGAIAGPVVALTLFEAALRRHPPLASLHFKRSFCTTRPFTLLKVHEKPELVAFGLPNVSGLSDRPDTHVSPQDWRELIRREDVVVLDNRNHFEFELGHFAGAIDPQVRHFRDFPAYVQAHADTWKREGKTVAMYCTGGIRCEKLSGWMLDQGLQVRQLEGGIVNYFEQMPDAEADWLGECFVFDKRIAIDTQRRETATTAEDVYGDDPAEAWRLARARRLDPGSSS
ncbi:rhodanese-like domain-containing protein [Roseateles sp. SL47]|uniref:oxygen-dependent tRNA uridine(34) hydroxylase TrhO n=1 Tax=Roseateles sp. SL47 TaxID=2995138 RepID=UPI002272283B|nr:rhodanese-like domain-containing protein [Roseateles sp. SL47]WAC74191.1 rhodanese-like domain-containing protein [Roseateles sp. SL47]